MLNVTCGLRGHNVTCDSFFTSYKLKRKITIVGKVRRTTLNSPLYFLQLGEVCLHAYHHSSFLTPKKEHE